MTRRGDAVWDLKNADTRTGNRGSHPKALYLEGLARKKHYREGGESYGSTRLQLKERRGAVYGRGAGGKLGDVKGKAVFGRGRREREKVGRVFRFGGNEGGRPQKSDVIGGELLSKGVGNSSQKGT